MRKVISVVNEQDMHILETMLNDGFNIISENVLSRNGEVLYVVEKSKDIIKNVFDLKLTRNHLTICGNTIDLTKIYNVSLVKEFIYVAPNDESKNFITGAGFVIEFVNKKSQEIVLDINYKIVLEKYLEISKGNTDKYLQEGKNNLDRINKLRSELINYWTKCDHSLIPKIDL